MNATISRRQFVKNSALLGGCAALMSRIEWALSQANAAEVPGA